MPTPFTPTPAVDVETIIGNAIDTCVETITEHLGDTAGVVLMVVEEPQPVCDTLGVAFTQLLTRLTVPELLYLGELAADPAKGPFLVAKLHEFRNGTIS